MPTITLSLSHPINESTQIGDSIYYTLPSPVGEFQQANTNTIVDVGYPISAISFEEPYSISVDYPQMGSITIPPEGAYLMFSKDGIANTSEIKGYYLSATFTCDSRERAELFQVSAGVAESSK
tara:strand:+ start:3298 stop:3666 length:369 start_codon:yes stop_codon:yes gene_type:complete